MDELPVRITACNYYNNYYIFLPFAAVARNIPSLHLISGEVCTAETRILLMIYIYYYNTSHCVETCY